MTSYYTPEEETCERCAAIYIDSSGTCIHCSKLNNCEAANLKDYNQTFQKPKVLDLDLDYYIEIIIGSTGLFILLTIICLLMV